MIYPTNDMPNDYIYDILFNDLFIYFAVAVFSVLVLRKSSEIHKGCNSVIL